MKKILCSSLIIMLLFSFNANSTSAKWSKDFRDVSYSNSHASNIYYLAEMNIIKGYTSSNSYYQSHYFSPNNNVTKRQVATMLVRALKLEGANYSNPGFKDVPLNDPGFKAIAIATQQGFFAKESYFKPNSYITRAEMANTLMKAFKLTGSTNLNFTDIPTHHHAYQAVQALAANNITVGNNGRFNPNQTLTRAQFSSFLTRALLPAARPSIHTIYANAGLVPKTFGKRYTYQGGYEGNKYSLPFSYAYDTSSGDTTSIRMENSIAQGDMAIEYAETASKFTLDVTMPYNSANLQMPYPIQLNKLVTIRDSDFYNKVTIAVRDFNGIYKVGNKIYTNVMVVEEKSYLEYSPQPFQKTYLIAKDVGLLALFTHTDNYELLSIY